MEKVWYIVIDGKKEGPYTPHELKRHPRITPDTLVWKTGMPQWVPIRSIPELINIFEEEGLREEQEEEEEPKEEEEEKTPKKVKESEEVLTMRYEPPFYYYFWLLVAVLVILYTLYQWLVLR